MELAQRFKAYADDFEVSYLDDDWSRIAPYFTEDASYDAGNGTETAHGRDAVLEKLKGAVDGLDRRLDQRDLEFHEMSTTADTVTAPWTVRFTKGSIPVLEVSGQEIARYSGDAIVELRSVIEADSMTAFGAWMATYGDQL